MSDTQKDLTALLATLVVNNASGAITAQMIRDALVSVLGGYGSIFIDSGSGSQAASSGGAAVTQLTSSGPVSGVTFNTAAGTLTVGVAGDYLVDARCEFVGVASQSYTLTAGTGLVGVAQVNAAADRAVAAFQNIVTLTANQTLTLNVSNPSNNAFALKSGHWMCKRVS
jgi:hypothetical protein